MVKLSWVRSVVIIAITAPLAFDACIGRAASSGAVAIRFVDLYKPEMLHGSAPPAGRAPTGIEWRFDGPAPVPAPKELAATRGWEAGIGISDLTIRDGWLLGRSSSAYPVLQIERSSDLDNRDQFYAIEIRMKVSAGGNVSVIDIPTNTNTAGGGLIH